MKNANHAEGQFDLSVLAEWMKSQGIIDHVQLDAKALTGGQSNPTFLLSSGKQKLVLRKKPPGALLPSAHAVDREYRVMKALLFLPATRALYTCKVFCRALFASWWLHGSFLFLLYQSG